MIGLYVFDHRLHMNAARTFRSDRLYKILRGIVLGVTFISILLFLHSSYLDRPDYLVNKWGKYCDQNPYPESLTKITGHTCMDNWIDETYRVRQIQKYSLITMLLTPAVFFGRSAIFNYLYPKSETPVPYPDKKPEIPES